MRFIVYGAGGIGGSLGARLHQAGEEVLLIARGDHLTAIKSNGLQFVTPSQNVRLRIPAVGHPSEIDFHDNDCVVLSMKGQHTQGALDDLYAVAPDSIPVVCCQNGVANERIACRRFSRVYGMVVLVPAEHLTPGQVINFAEDKAGNLDAGRYPSGIDEVVSHITAAVDRAGFLSQPDPDIMAQKYAKLLMNLNNAVQAASGAGSQELSRQLRSEALACYEAAAIRCATADQSRLRRAGINGGPVTGFARHGGSSMQSVMRRTGDIEADFLNGEIVQLGRLHRVATPANRVVQRIGNKVARERLEVGAISITEIERLVAAERQAN